VLHQNITRLRNSGVPGNPFDCAAKHVVLFEQGRATGGVTMREEFASNSFLAVTVAGLFLLCSGFVAFAFT
jgi:hypothetical protein